MENLNVIQEINDLAVKIHQKELEAVDHDQKAKLCRAEKAEFRQQYSELNAQVNDAKIVHALKETLSAAKKAQERAEQAAKQVEELVVTLKKDVPDKVDGD